MNILAIDIGGTGLKAAVLDSKGNMLTERVRVKTQAPITSQQLVETSAELRRLVEQFKIKTGANAVESREAGSVMIIKKATAGS